ncbi:MAG: molecular chaperone HtpG [Thermaurantimonas sp.]
MSTSGKINVTAENIFPIIKKFLYSDHEIFLRELISNAVDASTKLKTLASIGEFKGDLGDLTIKVKIDKNKKTITISDRGVGMTQDEIRRYINEVAFSGAEEFVNKYKDKAGDAGIIGHFGLGFYSAFMVAEKVEIYTKSWTQTSDEDGTHWECTGSPEFVMNPVKRSDIGTDIVLHISDDSKEFLEEYRIRELLKKYCRFLPIPIQFGTKEITEKDEKGKEVKKTVPDIINNPSPAWTKKPSELTHDDYIAFYRELYPLTFEEPLFYIHLNVDYPFNLTGILYFPRIKPMMEPARNKIQLYQNQVFVTDSLEGVVPEFLTLLHGVIDSKDIPLNVSRSYLQSDASVKKISSHITKKVADKLEEMFKNNRPDFEQKWNDIKIFIEYGMLSDEKFYERARKFALFPTTEGKYYTLDELRKNLMDIQTDKDGKLILLYTTDKEAQHTYNQKANDLGYTVLVLDSPLTSHFINRLEYSQDDKIHFTRVDAGPMDQLIQKKDASRLSVLSQKQKDDLRDTVAKVVDKEMFTVRVEDLSSADEPMMITQPEFMRRMKEMNMMGGGFYGSGKLPESYDLIVNGNHPIALRILDTHDQEKQKMLIQHCTDLAMLQQNLLKGEALSKFIQRSIQMMN